MARHQQGDQLGDSDDQQTMPKYTYNTNHYPNTPGPLPEMPGTGVIFSMHGKSGTPTVAAATFSLSSSAASGKVSASPVRDRQRRRTKDCDRGQGSTCSQTHGAWFPHRQQWAGREKPKPGHRIDPWRRAFAAFASPECVGNLKVPQIGHKRWHERQRIRDGLRHSRPSRRKAPGHRKWNCRSPLRPRGSLADPFLLLKRRPSSIISLISRAESGLVLAGLFPAVGPEFGDNGETSRSARRLSR